MKKGFNFKSVRLLLVALLSFISFGLVAQNNPKGGTWKVTNSQEFKEAAKLTATLPISTIELVGYDYTITDSIVFPKFPVCEMVFVVGHGANLFFTGKNVNNGITREYPNSADEANRMQSRRISFSGLNGEDKGSTKVFINTLCTYQASVVDCKGTYFTNTFVNTFGLQTIYDRCESINADSSGFINDFFSSYNGSPGTALRSNNTWYYNCRVFCKEGSYVGFGNYGNSGSNYLNCIAEGGAPFANIIINSMGSSVVNNSNIGNGTHFENKAKYGAIIDIRQGHNNIEDLYSQYAMVLIKTSSSAGYPTLTWTNCGWWTSGTTLETDGKTSWIINNGPPGIDLEETKYWVANKLPISYVFTRFGGPPISPSRNYVVQSTALNYDAPANFLLKTQLPATTTVSGKSVVTK